MATKKTKKDTTEKVEYEAKPAAPKVWGDFQPQSMIVGDGEGLSFMVNNDQAIEAHGLKAHVYIDKVNENDAHVLISQGTPDEPVFDIHVKGTENRSLVSEVLRVTKILYGSLK